MPNPAGTNQFEREQPYGARKMLDNLKRSATMAGAQGATSAIETPRRAKRKAARGEREQRAPVPGTEPVGAAPATDDLIRMAQAQSQQNAPTLPYEQRVLAVWEEIAAHPEASPLAREYLEVARRAAAR